MLSCPGIRRRDFWIDVIQGKHEVTIHFTFKALVEMEPLLRELSYWRQATMVVFIEQHGIRCDHHGHVIASQNEEVCP